MIEKSPRYAIYFAPVAHSALSTFGNGVLGRDAERDVDIDVFPQLKQRFPNWRTHVSVAAHYGFHATLKPPFALAPGIKVSAVRQHVAELADSLSPISIGQLKVDSIGRFVALVPVSTPVDLATCAARIVRSLDPLRAPLSEQDRARRRPETLSPQQIEYLDQWGYPYVLDEFRFHMTLTGPLPDGERQEAVQSLRTLYEPFDQSVNIKEICIFAQSHSTAHFTQIERIRLAG
jgi:putative phosphonate metabolism protein